MSWAEERRLASSGYLLFDDQPRQRQHFIDALQLSRVDARGGRRFLDRIVGYKLSPLLSLTLAERLTAGRVQSVALRLIVERLTRNAALNGDLMQEALIHLWRLEEQRPGQSQHWYLRGCRFHLAAGHHHPLNRLLACAAGRGDPVRRRFRAGLGCAQRGP